MIENIESFLKNDNNLAFYVLVFVLILSINSGYYIGDVLNIILLLSLMFIDNKEYSLTSLLITLVFAFLFYQSYLKRRETYKNVVLRRTYKIDQEPLMYA